MKTEITFSKFKVNDRAFDVAKFLKLAKTELLNTMARLRSETGQGRGADGQQIKPGGYSESYRKAIESEAGVRGGSRGKGVRKASADPVNLTVSGDLLGSMQVRQVATGAEIFFNGDHYTRSGRKLTNAALASALMTKGFQHWFEYGQVDEKRIDAAFDKLVDDAVKKLIDVK